MSRLSDFRKMSLGEVSRELAIHPFDLIRVLVAHDRLPPCLTFTRGEVAEIRQVEGFEHLEVGQVLPEDVGDPDLVDVDLLLLDEVQQEVQRTAENRQFDPVGHRR